jgi:hypothetical protein
VTAWTKRSKAFRGVHGGEKAGGEEKAAKEFESVTGEMVIMDKERPTECACNGLAALVLLEASASQLKSHHRCVPTAKEPTNGSVPGSGQTTNLPNQPLRISN